LLVTEITSGVSGWLDGLPHFCFPQRHVPVVYFDLDELGAPDGFGGVDISCHNCDWGLKLF